jgi:hypothetical protein
MIASPGDVANERRIARDTIYEWNAVHSEDRKTVLLPVLWETHASPAMGARAQEIINKQILRGSDLLIAVFWTRLGTPTGVAGSGTVEEIEEHLRAGRPAMLYFSTAPVRPDSIDEQQYRALSEFKDSVRQRGLFEEYESLTEFQAKLTRQLAQSVILHFPVTNHSAPSQEVATEVKPISLDIPDTATLSPEERQLLSQAVLDQHGVILMVDTFGGLTVETNGQSFAESGNPRSEAKWRSVVNELLGKGYIEQSDRNGEVFAVTNAGYGVK